MNWGKWIVISFILFAIFIGVLVAVCVRQDVHLVSQNYYQEELVFQDQVVRESNASKLALKPLITMASNQTLQIYFTQFNEIESGELILFRPSDPALDKKFHLMKSTALTQQFPVATFQRGMYRARMSWTMGGKEFYVEEVIYI